MQVIIMRGLPGAGKDRYIERKWGLTARLDVVICSADHYHMFDGQYRYDPANAAKAHNMCLKWFSMMLGKQVETVVVSNTNTTAVEIAPYYQLALALGYEVKIVHIKCDFETACRRNIHQVPPSTIWAMYQNLLTERMRPWWKEEFVFPDDDILA